MAKKIPVTINRNPADKSNRVGFRPKSHIDAIKGIKLEAHQAGKRRGDVADKRKLLNENKQYLTMQFKITRQLLKSASPSNAVIEQARRLGRLVKSSNEEMNQLELIADQDIPIALFAKRPNKPIPLKFGPERRLGPSDRREYDYHISKERRNQKTDRRSLLNYKRQYLSLQYRITQQLLKAVSPSKKIIEHACKIGRITKTSEEELTKLQLILKPSRIT